MAIEIHEEKNIKPQKNRSNISPSMGSAGDELDIGQQNAEIREAIYSFLSSVYLQPLTEESLQHICDGIFLNDLAEVLPGDATDDLQHYLSALDPGSLSEELTVLKQEYMSLFTVPTGRYVAPFEDIYRGKTSDGQPQRGPLLGVRAIAAKQLYREAGAQMDGICKELPNHIGVELSFMRFLCEREATELIDEIGVDVEQDTANDFSQAEIYRAYQIRFLAEHLTNWFPQLNEEIQNKSGHVFYRSIANMTQTFTQQDLSSLKQQLIDSLQ